MLSGPYLAVTPASSLNASLALQDGSSVQVNPDVKGRVAETLLMLHHKFGADEMGQIAMNLTRQVMAAYAGTTYETFFRMLNELKAEGLIQQTDESLILLDAEKLATLTHTDP